jgi:hypothetical protein
MMPEVKEQIVRATQGIQSYLVQVEHRPGPRILGQIDKANRRQRLELGLSEGPFPIAELEWQDRQGYGRHRGSERWFELSDRPLPHYPEILAHLLQQGQITGEREEDNTWVVELSVGLPDILLAPQSFRRALFGDPRDRAQQRFFDSFERMLEGLAIRIELVIGSPEGPIKGCHIYSTTERFTSDMNISVEPTQARLPRLPDYLSEQLIRGITVPSYLLLLDLPDLAGWNPEETHATWAERAVQLIRDSESPQQDHERRYAEIYNWPAASGARYTAYTEGIARMAGLGLDPQQHHPIVLGAYNEDNSDPFPLFYQQWFQSDPDYQANPGFYWNPAGYFRDYHHFGGLDVGLKHRWYFELRGSPATTRPDDRFYSARDWGYGSGRINEVLNRLTFTEAVRQYNTGTFEGKRNAYLMLGHVIHLLQDVGQPDHANLVDHAGSGKTMASAYDEYHYCELLGWYAFAQACGVCWLFCPFCGVPAYGAAYGVCRGTINASIVGYEKLIADMWSLNAAEPAVGNTGVSRLADYDAHFASLAQQSSEASATRGLVSPLGCTDLLVFFPPSPVPISIPGAMPIIDSSNDPSRSPFLELTSQLVPMIISYSASLICHFLDIVTPPPIVERVRIVQWEAGARPLRFGTFANSSNHCVRYDQAWKMRPGAPAPGGPRQRQMQSLHASQPLSHDRPAYIFVSFGPTTSLAEGRAMAQVVVRLRGVNPVDGTPIDQLVPMEMASDPDVGFYYWGNFRPRNCAPDPYELRLHIEGRDHAAHLTTREPIGDVLDADPSTIATVNPTINGGLRYDWTYYHAGSDQHHRIQVAAFGEVRLLASPEDSVVRLNRVGQEERVTLRFEQTAWNCQWEEFWSVLTCPVRWRLREEVRSALQSGRVRDAISFGFSARIEIGRGTQVAEIVCMIPDGPFRRGRYSLNVDYEVGEAPYVRTGSHTITVAVG